MLRTVHYLFFITIIFIPYISSMNNIAFAQTRAYQEQKDMLQKLSPERRRAAEKELKKNSSVLTPRMIESLKEKPEYKGLTPDDIIKGKELLQKQETDREREEQKEEQLEKEVSPVEEEEPLSLFERYRTAGLYQSISTELKPFGYDFFSRVTTASSIPRRDIPVSSDYIIGPGDEIKILIWGRVNDEYELVVDRDGNISIPQIGPLQVAGMSFDEMKNYLADQTDQIIGAKINITLGALKSIHVFVLGEVKKPGSYSLDSFSTITTAILSAGGPTDIGSLRSIQLKRKNKTFLTMDFYDFLLKGDKSQDQVLQAGDVIFVPVTGPLAGIAGNVKRPAIYELKDKYDLMNLFDMAGGVIPSAFTQQIQVERIQKNEKEIVIDIDDRNLTKSKDFLLQDGDLVKVFSIVDLDANAVFLSGNVKRPGKYEYKHGMRVKDLIKDPADLLEETYFEYALIRRVKLPRLETELIPFHPGKLLFNNEEAQNIPLEPRDAIYVFSKWMFYDVPQVTVEGEVRFTGSFDLLKNYRLKDAILEAGGLTKDASLGRGEILRTNEQGDVSQVYFNVGRAMAEDPGENIVLQDRDTIIIHSLWEGKNRQTVSIEGDVNTPGLYPLAQYMRVSDLIFSAGSILESAYLDEAEISSLIIDNGKSVRIDYRKINLGRALDNDPENDVFLKPYDRVFVKRIPDWREERFVELSGEINFPGRYIIKTGERLSSVLQRAGGYGDNAYLRGAVFTRKAVKELQQINMKKMVLRLERNLLAEGSMQVSVALSKEEIEAKKVEQEQKQKFIESLKKLEATGRMSIRLAHLRLFKGSQYDIELENGDSLFIPLKNNVVNVMGSVMSPSSFIYTDNLDYENYIEMAGGYTKFADEERTYVLKVDGTARKLPNGTFHWNNSKDRWEMTAFDETIKDIEPGDTIVVPEKLDRIAWLRETKDITQILFQIAVAAGVLIVAF